MNADTTLNIISYFLLFYVIARLEWLNYKIGKLEGRLCKENPDISEKEKSFIKTHS